jgi:hypothetical protein
VSETGSSGCLNISINVEKKLGLGVLYQGVMMQGGVGASVFSRRTSPVITQSCSELQKGTTYLKYCNLTDVFKERRFCG